MNEIDITSIEIFSTESQPLNVSIGKCDFKTKFEFIWNVGDKK